MESPCRQKIYSKEILLLKLGRSQEPIYMGMASARGSGFRLQCDVSRVQTCLNTAGKDFVGVDQLASSQGRWRDIWKARKRWNVMKNTSGEEVFLCDHSYPSMQTSPSPT